MRFIHGLSLETQHLLRRCYKESKHHRVRQRAHCILLSFCGKTTDDLVHIFHVTRLTIYHWFDAWETRHFAGLYDHAGRGRHPKLTREEQEKVQQYIADYPQDMKKVVHLLAQETSKRVWTKTSQRLRKKIVLSGNVFSTRQSKARPLRSTSVVKL
jgi:transposase